MFSIFIIRFIVWDSIGDPRNKNYLLRNKFSKCVGTKSTYFQKKISKSVMAVHQQFLISRNLLNGLWKKKCVNHKFRDSNFNYMLLIYYDVIKHLCIHVYNLMVCYK